MDRACEKFQETMTGECLSYLQGRGIDKEAAASFRLGVVPDGVRGYEQYNGRMAIPYTDRIGVYGWKFRCITHDDCKQENCPRYLNPPGQELGLFNVLALDSPADVLHVCEGEMDCIVLSTVVPDPVVAVPGASLWHDHWPLHLSGFDRICVWPDADDAGTKMARRWQDKCGQIEIMSLPKGQDVNSVFLKEGGDYFVKLLEDAGEE